MTPHIPTAGQTYRTLALAAFFWWVNFGLHWVNFSIGMGTAASTLALLSFWFAGVPMDRTEWTWRAVRIGLIRRRSSMQSSRSAIRFPAGCSGLHRSRYRPSTTFAMKVRRLP
ncbi:MAG: hypothetical protein V8Q84_06805 [Bilophila sp.]